MMNVDSDLAVEKARYEKAESGANQKHRTALKNIEKKAKDTEKSKEESSDDKKDEKKKRKDKKSDEEEHREDNNNDQHQQDQRGNKRNLHGVVAPNLHIMPMVIGRRNSG